MGDVVRMEPNTMAVIFSMDLDPGFYVKLCNDATLFDTVHGGMFMADQTEQSRGETADVVAVLRETGSMDFEDGWIQLRIGMADTVAFLVEKIGEAKVEERYADGRRLRN